MKRLIFVLAIIFSLSGMPVVQAATMSSPKAIYAAVSGLPSTVTPGQIIDVKVRIDRKNLPSTATRLRVAPTPGVSISRLPTLTKNKEITFRVTISKTAKLGNAQVKLSLSQSGFIARLPMAFRIDRSSAPTKPAAIAPVPIASNTPISAVGPCQIFPANNAWNQDVSKTLKHWNSDAYITSIGATRTLHPDFGENQEYGIPVTIASEATPESSIRFTDYGDESDPGPYPIPSNARIEAGSDAHVIVLHPSRCKLYELFGARREGNGWAAASGAVFNLNSNSLRPQGWTSADAAGLPIYPGLLKYDEVASGKITHAIRFTAPRTQNGFIHPATHQAGRADASLPPMGLRVRLKADYDISRLTGQARVIAEAMKTYGMILSDNGSAWYFQGATDPRWNDSELNQLKTVPGNAFEAVETGPILK